MPKKRTTDEYFNIIKINHKKYLDTNMVTHLAAAGAENKKPVIDRYVSYIRNYRELEKKTLDDAIRNTSTAEKAGRGVFSALVGASIGGMIFTGEQHAPSVDALGIKATVQGGFAAIIGASCGALIYSVWEKSCEKPAHADFNACKAEMKKAGFTTEKYTKLSADLVKLFYFRECLLLGLNDKDNVSMRVSFKNRYYSSKNVHTFDEADFNLAIEVYFLEQLNTLFQQAFQTIYQLHDAEIKEEEHTTGFIRWFKRHFETEENQQRFTQQMQVAFMNECIHFLEQQMFEPSFIGKYPFLIDSIAGLIAGSIAVGIVSVSIPFIPLFGLIGIAIVSACLAAINTHLTITHVDALNFKRDQDNRHAILAAIKCIGSEQKRLTTLMQKVVVTTHHDLAGLKQYDQQGQSAFRNMLTIKEHHPIALGSVKAWIREFTNRFNESKFVEIDLSDCIKQIVNDAHDQTSMLQAEWVRFLSTDRVSSELLHLTELIKNTTHYLKKTEHAGFIQTFELLQKIKEQILEIIGLVSIVPSINKALPLILTNFYTAPVSEGGLNGLLSDLNDVRRIAPIAEDHAIADAHHPYHRFLETAFTINLKVNASANRDYILPGDRQYRKMLGLPVEYCMRLEDKITVANIQDYLIESFNFLCSLNQYETNVDWDIPFQNHEEYILYRTLLVKQLANLADPNNLRVDNLIKEDIIAFARLKLNCNPSIAFDDILNQALLCTHGMHEGTIYDQLENPRSINELSYISDAVRVNIAYVSTPLTPQHLITLEAYDYLKKNSEKIILGCTLSKKLIPEFSDYFYHKATESIETTIGFIETIKTRTLLQQTGTLRIYLQVIIKEIEHLKQQINQLISLSSSQLSTLNPNNLRSVIAALDAFQQTLPAVTPVSQARTISFHTQNSPLENRHRVFTSIEPGVSRAASSSLTLIHPENALLNFRENDISDPNNTSQPEKEITVPQGYIDALRKFIAKQEAEATKEQHSPHFFQFNPTQHDFVGAGHHHTRANKIKAATNLLEALEQIKSGETPEAHNWNDEIYTTNKHLSAIIREYCAQDLDPLHFRSNSLGFG